MAGWAGAREHRRSQDFVWGSLFSSKKLTTFLIVTLKTEARNYTKFPKNLTLALSGGAFTYNLYL